VYRSRIHDVDQLKSRLIEEWEHFHQVFIDEAIRQWRPGLRASIRAHGGHFEQSLVIFDICTDVPFDSHMSVRLPIQETFDLGGVNSLNPLYLLQGLRFYLNLLISLQLDSALPIQNAVKV